MSLTVQQLRTNAMCWIVVALEVLMRLRNLKSNVLDKM